MSRSTKHMLRDARVVVAQTPRRDYADSKTAARHASDSLNRIATTLDWYAADRGPLARIIEPGSRVLIKPNLVIHRNEGPWGIEPLVTHPSLIQAAVMAALQAGAGEVVVGDAPVQGCDFDELLVESGLRDWESELKSLEPRFGGVRDFRRTRCTFENGIRNAAEDLIDETEFVLFDLGSESLLEPVTADENSFRVTCYDPRLLARTHMRGRHQYLIARQVIEADVVINLPKLKTHKKAGVTCALKNLIGINGNKEYLPHHRAGGSGHGGDCYPGSSYVKRALEYTLDRQNMSSSLGEARLWRGLSRNLDRISSIGGDSLGVEGSWSGNDTVWRTCLDLNRILVYGRGDATLAERPQRRVVHIVDSVIAGQGDGPLAPEPLPLGLIFGGTNAAAVDWVGALILGYDPLKIPITRHAFDEFSWPLAEFSTDDVAVLGDFGEGDPHEVMSTLGVDSIRHPAGWRAATRT